MPHEVPHLLTDLVVDENSLVTAGANKGAKIILLKSECDKMESKERNSLVTKIAEYFNVGKREGNKLIIDAEDEPLSKELEQLQKSMAILAASNLVLTAKSLFADLISVAVDSIAKAVDIAAVDTALTIAKGGVVTIKKDTEIEDADLIKSFDDKIDKDLGERAKARKAELDKNLHNENMKTFRSKLKAGMQKAFDDMDEKDRLDFMGRFSKSDDGDPMAKALETVTNANEKLQKRLDKLEDQSDISKAKDEFKELEGFVKMDDFIGSVIKLRKLDTDAADQFISQTRAMAKQSAAGKLFKIIGKGGESESDADSKLNKAAENIRKSDPKMTEAESISKAIEINPDLYNEYEAENAG